jgi:hypothetical protein
VAWRTRACSSTPASSRGPRCRPLRTAGRARRGTCLVLHCLRASGPDLPAPPRPWPPGTTLFPSSSQRDGERSRWWIDSPCRRSGTGSGAGGGSRRTGNVGEIRNERMEFLTHETACASEKVKWQKTHPLRGTGWRQAPVAVAIGGMPTEDKKFRRWSFLPFHSRRWSHLSKI